MAYSDTINLVKGDTLPELKFTLKDSNQAAEGKRLDANNSDTWAPIPLNGASVVLRIREVGSTTVKTSLSCIVSDAASGQVFTDFPEGTLDKEGTFEGELELTFDDGGKQTVHDLIKLKVRGDFG